MKAGKNVNDQINQQRVECKNPRKFINYYHYRWISIVIVDETVMQFQTENDNKEMKA